MLDHLSFGVRDLALAGAFYDAALTPLGYVRLFSKERGIGYGRAGDRDEQFAIISVDIGSTVPATGFHLAFSATSRHAVDGFHREAIRMGGADNGAPGLRDPYGPGYYAAFVRDLDGYRIEAVFHEV